MHGAHVVTIFGIAGLPRIADPIHGTLKISGGMVARAPTPNASRSFVDRLS